MGKQAVLGLLVVLVTGGLWMAPDPVRSQDSGAGNGKPSVGFPYPYSEVHPVTIADRLLWAGISLINPQSDRKPVFIYSYELSKLDKKIVTELLSEAAAGNIRIAILKPSPKGDGTYEGKAVHILSSLPDPDLDALGDDDTSWRAGEHESDSRFVELSRPLYGFSDVQRRLSAAPRVALSRPLHDFSGTAEVQEFVAKPGFWPSVVSKP